MSIFGPVVANYGDRKKSFNFHQKIILLVMDITLLAELCYTMHAAYPAGDAFSAIFLRTYAPLFFPTVILGIWLCRRFRDRQVASESMGQAKAAAPEA
ncbi:hypothetical protein PCS_01998 [Desulfocurvibacter africanus PCS]|uniref:Uncharacterized protein n=1 Tax=Desulfocurvibacter africanus PCS TaxID=1262666 RepID=M5PRZ6_DESAF|nr:hypothetical protein [Desulfocurvibacter africanus]EMG37162.1 hypothetical protein PCS_01998 [Desulfocurvibacter africanus PCS]